MKFAKRRHSVATALELCGGITDDYPIRIPMTDNSAASVALAKEVGAITQAAFVSAGNKLSAALLLAAQQASMQHGNTLIIINETTKHPGISEIQAILGKADSTEEGRLEAVTWHKYGWCHFGVSNARVVKLRADCDKSNN